jgi:hypothetical protein
MQNQLRAVLQSFQNKYRLNSNRMFLIIKYLVELESEKMTFEWSRGMVENIIVGHISESDKRKIQDKVEDSEFYQVFFEEIAEDLGVRFFLSQNPRAQQFEAPAVE